MPSGRFRERFGPTGRLTAYSEKKLCLVATDAAFLVDLLYGLSLREDCVYVKYGTISRDGMYLGRCSFTTDEAISELCQALKGHPRLMVSLQDDAWFDRFRDEPLPSGSCGVWDDWDEHVPAVTAVLEAAFGRADEAAMVTAIRAARAATISLAAQLPPERAGQPWPIVGHVLLSRVTVDGCSEARGLGLAPLAVAPAHQRKGFGGRLVEAALRRARELGEAFVVVLGRSDYYSRFGFVAASTFGLVYEKTVPDENFMALELVRSALRETRGIVRYHPAISGEPTRAPASALVARDPD